jgi:hypothetical protein
MTKTFLAAMTAFGLMSGIACAQTLSTSTTSTTTAGTPLVIGGSSSYSTSKTVDANGVQTDRTHTTVDGTTVTPSGEVAATHKTTETTTVR